MRSSKKIDSMNLEFGIYNESTRQGTKKWVVAIHHVDIDAFLGLTGSAARRNRERAASAVYFHYWTVGHNGKVLISFTLSLQSIAVPRSVGVLKLHTENNGPWGICNPTLLWPETSIPIEIPKKYTSNRRPVVASAEENNGHPIYSFELPKGWILPLDKTPRTRVPEKQQPVENVKNGGTYSIKDAVSLVNSLVMADPSLFPYVREDRTIGVRVRETVEREL